jgi:hypothetical protein
LSVSCGVFVPLPGADAQSHQEREAWGPQDSRIYRISRELIANVKSIHSQESHAYHTNNTLRCTSPNGIHSMTGLDIPVSMRSMPC